MPHQLMSNKTFIASITFALLESIHKNKFALNISNRAGQADCKNPYSQQITACLFWHITAMTISSDRKIKIFNK